MANRPVELQELISANKEYFGLLQRSLDPAKWIEFMDLIPVDRDQMCDCRWMHEVGNILGTCPVLHAEFKAMVGYDETRNKEHH